MKSTFVFAACVALGASFAQAQGTAGVPATINVGNGQATATFPAGLGGLSTGSVVSFTPGAASSASQSPYYVATNAEQSSTLASLNTHFSQAISAATPTTGPPTGISTGVTGGFDGANTLSILDGSITTIPNAATTYTGPRSSSSSGSSAQGQSSGALGMGVNGAVMGAMAAVVVGVVGGGAWVL
ncbi:hypothetical protein PSEUBRA_005221 [Kalmanozyma brasiliensis GHG001]|uniref:Uncharacterized protein n=1 Tax=Kalmanozyma brasiliensis (strain GHG001) TaxID=1365824 RepID=V5ERK4_KALBG|nr:uncharacterized protein PSEUBRA_005221 [Kalmanozyma brasiliensis GHG001]EST05538.1 hypothetical protein PSEUBRA_005221 [Kalmanozyma brasiliensis GHG001]